MTTFTFDNLSQKDIKDLIPIVEHWVKDRNTGKPILKEVKDIRGRFEASLSDHNPEKYVYVVARDKAGKAVGVMGFRTPEDAMKIFVHEGVPTVEMVNVFTHPNIRKQGLGVQLLDQIFAEAKAQGFTQMIWNSGPRYKDTAWAFYSKHCGEPEAMANEFYGEGGDAPIWRKIL